MINRLNFIKWNIIGSLTIVIIALTIGKGFGQNETEIDTLFNDPYIDQKEWRDIPMRHLYVHGGFKGTDTRFSFYFPEKEIYEGRFTNTLHPPRIMNTFRKT